MDVKIPFTFISGHLIVIRITLNDEEHKFILDTGIGVTVISRRVAEHFKLNPDSSFSGKRMSGQEVSIQLASMKSVGVGPIKKSDVTVGIFDMSSFPPELGEISGILSPGFLEEVVFTVNYQTNEILLRDDSFIIEDSGTTISHIDLKKEGPSLSIYIDAIIPSERLVKLEVDSGSRILILNSAFMEELNIGKEEPDTKIFRGTDESGYNFTRYLSTLDGKISISKAEEIFQVKPKVMFQDIVYDGLLGTEFLKNYNVTYDLLHKKMGFSAFKP